MTYPVAGVVVSPDTAANWGAPRLWLRPPLFLLAFGILLPRIPSLGAWRHGGHHADALLHINNIVTEGELLAESVVKESLTTAADGKAYGTKVYNLDAIETVTYF